eukprot:COSAG02_NODE_25031_length_670_cov_7.460595_1_plen_84_part_00
MQLTLHGPRAGSARAPRGGGTRRSGDKPPFSPDHRVQDAYARGFYESQVTGMSIGISAKNPFLLALAPLRPSTMRYVEDGFKP